MNKIAIILVNYNSFGDTLCCLKSVQEAQKESTSLPLIVIVDNASTENADLATLYNSYPKLKILYNQENIGFGRANNIGIDWVLNNTDSEYIFLLNNDTTIVSSTIEELIRPLLEDRNIGISTCRIMYMRQPERVWYGGGFMHKWRNTPRITDLNHLPQKEGALKSKEVDFISGCAMMFRRETIIEIGKFDPAFFMYYEDLELCIRAKLKGYKLWYTADTLLFHKVGGDYNQYKGLHPNNPNIIFHYYHKMVNQWIAFAKHKDHINYSRFCMTYVVYFLGKTTLLFIKSPKRLEVFRKSFNVLGKIISYSR